MNLISVFVAISYIIIQYALNKLQHGDKSLKVIIKDSFVVGIAAIAACYIYDIFFPSKEILDSIAPVFMDKAPF